MTSTAMLAHWNLLLNSSEYHSQYVPLKKTCRNERVLYLLYSPKLADFPRYEKQKFGGVILVVIYTLLQIILAW